MNVGSLFAGIGGFDLGLERSGMQVAWQVELDPYCRAVLAQHFPQARRYEDVCEVGAENLAPVDLVCGGFPCQDLSAAGKGAGLAGARSGLWSEFARIVREIRPRYVVVENVPALLTGKGKRWDRAPVGRVLGDLAEMGYDAEWACLSAREFGAPHLRKRVWIVAYPARDAEARPVSASGSERQRAGEGGASCRAGAGTDADPRRLPLLAQLDGEAQERHPARPRRQHPHRLRDAVPDADGEQHQGPPHALGWSPGEELWDHWATEPNVGRVADGVPARVDRLAALGNALLPQIAEWIGLRILEHEGEVEARRGRR